MIMTETEFVYTTYIRSTPEKVWNAIVTPEFTRQYWGHELISDWKKGSRWESIPNGGECSSNVVGEILEATPPTRLVMTWLPSGKENDAFEHSRVTFEIEAIIDDTIQDEALQKMVRLNVIHDKLKDGSIMSGKIQIGWPRVLASMKTLLETGTALSTWACLKSSCSTAEKAGVA
jgi:uncharacterized protein YndB with AHSA1/START domain